MKQIIGGNFLANYCGSPTDTSNCCNAYYRQGSNMIYSGTCGTCDDAGNGHNPNVSGGDKLCVQFA